MNEIIYTIIYGVKNDSKRLLAAIPTKATVDELVYKNAYETYYADTPPATTPKEIRERYFKAFCIAYRQMNPSEVNNILGYFTDMKLLNEGEGMMVSFARGMPEHTHA
jgi:hypothetical protein